MSDPYCIIMGMNENKTNLIDEQAIEIREALEDYWANPQDYTFADFEEIFQDRDPIEFL